MLLWRAAKGLAAFSPRDAELLYQSTLDSISQAWCINHYPVAEYVLAARRELFSQGLVPAAVDEALRKSNQGGDCPEAETVLLAGETSQLEDLSAADPALKLLEACGEQAKQPLDPRPRAAQVFGRFRVLERVAGVL